MRRWSILLAVAACQGDPQISLGDLAPGQKEHGDLSTPDKTDHIVQVTKPEVDVLWVVDNSCSMAEEQRALAQNFPEFLEFFLESGLDWHIGLVSTDTSNEEQNGKLMGGGGYPYLDDHTPNPTGVFAAITSQLGTAGSAEERGLLAAFRAINQPTDQHKARNKGFFREDAALQIIVISDEEDQSAPAEGKREFITFLQTLKNDEDTPVSLSAIVGPKPSGCHSSFGDALPGSIYIGVAEATGGLTESICQEDWSPLLTDLGLHAAGLRREYFLSEAPVPGTLHVWVVDRDIQYEGVDEIDVTPSRSVNDICTEEGNVGCFPFHYDATRNSIILSEYVPGPMAEVFIHYDLLSGLQPGQDDVLDGTGDTDLE